MLYCQNIRYRSSRSMLRNERPAEKGMTWKHLWDWFSLSCTRNERRDDLECCDLSQLSAMLETQSGGQSPHSTYGCLPYSHMQTALIRTSYVAIVALLVTWATFCAATVAAQ